MNVCNHQCSIDFLMVDVSIENVQSSYIVMIADDPHLNRIPNNDLKKMLKDCFDFRDFPGI